MFQAKTGPAQAMFPWKTPCLDRAGPAVVAAVSSVVAAMGATVAALLVEGLWGPMQVSVSSPSIFGAAPRRRGGRSTIACVSDKGGARPHEDGV